MSRYKKINENQVTDKETGEIINYDEILKAQQELIEEEYTQLKDECFLLGKNIPIKIVKLNGVKYPCVTIKKNYTFNKIFRGDMKMLLKNNNLSIHALAFIGMFEHYICFTRNNLIVDCENPTIEKLCKMLGIKRSKMFEILKELEDKYIIKRTKSGKDLIIYFNPFLFCSGGVVHKDTYDLFKFNPYNPEMYNESPAMQD
jgi:hypothetical protein